MTSFAFKTSGKGLFARLVARVDASDVLFAFFSYTVGDTLVARVRPFGLARAHGPCTGSV